MRSWEEFFLGDAYPPKGDYFSFLLAPAQDDVKTEKFAITNPKKIKSSVRWPSNSFVEGFLGDL
ncbi:hypothetical protein N9Z61_01460 [bacterium]|nr:hypothetical protein [bacterium]